MAEPSYPAGFSDWCWHKERARPNAVNLPNELFLNGRLDLTQAEGVLDLIRAQTDKGADLALHQAGGELSKWVRDLREDLLEILGSS